MQFHFFKQVMQKLLLMFSGSEKCFYEMFVEQWNDGLDFTARDITH